jgi:hypothetical protein
MAVILIDIIFHVHAHQRIIIVIKCSHQIEPLFPALSG